MQKPLTKMKKIAVSVTNRKKRVRQSHC